MVSLKVLQTILLFSGLITASVAVFFLGVGLFLYESQEPLVQLWRICTFEKSSMNLQETAARLAFVYSGVLLFVSLVGMMGVYKRLSSCLTFHSLADYIIIVVELLTVVIIVIHLELFLSTAEKCLVRSLYATYRGPTYEEKHSFSMNIDVIQMKYSCCGINNLTDFQHFEGWQRNWPDPGGEILHRAVVPFTCCKFKEAKEFSLISMEEAQLLIMDPLCPVSPTGANSHLKTGCFKIVRSLLEQSLPTVLACFLLLQLLQLSGCGLAIYLGKVTKHINLHSLKDQ